MIAAARKVSEPCLTCTRVVWLEKVHPIAQSAVACIDVVYKAGPCSFFGNRVTDQALWKDTKFPQDHVVPSMIAVATWPRPCFSLHETKKEYVPIPRMPPKIRCNPVSWITSCRLNISFISCTNTVGALNSNIDPWPCLPAHCFYSYSNKNPNCCRIYMLRTLWQTSPNTAVRSSLSPVLVQFVS